jgi:hypothetical protein
VPDHRHGGHQHDARAGLSPLGLKPLLAGLRAAVLVAMCSLALLLMLY